MSVDNDKYLEAVKYWRDKFNNQDKEVRTLNVASSLNMQINEIHCTREKAKHAYNLFLKETNEKIEYLKGELVRFKRID